MTFVFHGWSGTHRYTYRSVYIHDQIFWKTHSGILKESNSIGISTPHSTHRIIFLHGVVLYLDDHHMWWKESGLQVCLRGSRRSGRGSSRRLPLCSRWGSLRLGWTTWRRCGHFLLGLQSLDHIHGILQLRLEILHNWILQATLGRDPAY